MNRSVRVPLFDSSMSARLLLSGVGLGTLDSQGHPGPPKLDVAYLDEDRCHLT